MLMARPEKTSASVLCSASPRMRPDMPYCLIGRSGAGSLIVDLLAQELERLLGIGLNRRVVSHRIGRPDLQ